MATRRPIGKQQPQPLAEALSAVADEPPVGEPVARVLTVGGKPIPIEVQHLIPYANTDQGIEERQNDGRPRAMTEVVRDEFDKQFDKRAAVSEPWESEDPLMEIVDSVREPGMGYRFLSPSVIARKGKRKYEVVKDEETGDPVQFGNMVLGKMPIEKQQQRGEFYRRQGNEDLENARAKMRVEQEKLMHDNPGIGDVSLGEGSFVGGLREGIQRSRGSQAA